MIRRKLARAIAACAVLGTAWLAGQSPSASASPAAAVVATQPPPAPAVTTRRDSGLEPPPATEPGGWLLALAGVAVLAYIVLRNGGHGD